MGETARTNLILKVMKEKDWNFTPPPSSSIWHKILDAVPKSAYASTETFIAAVAAITMLVYAVYRYELRRLARDPNTAKWRESTMRGARKTHDQVYNLLTKYMPSVKIAPEAAGGTKATKGSKRPPPKMKKEKTTRSKR